MTGSDLAVVGPAADNRADQPSLPLTAALAASTLFEALALAPATLEAYSRAFAVFMNRCDALGVPPLPCTTEHLCAVMGAMAAEGRSAARLGVILAAVRKAHRGHGWPDPTADERVRAVLKGVRNAYGSTPHRKTPLYALPRPGERESELERVLAAIDAETLVGKRDRALLLLGFAAALRRSELAGLEVADLEATAKGVLVTIRRSKTDQAAVGQEVAVPFGQPGTCPVRAVQDWLQAARIGGGRLFRGVRKNGRLRAGLTPHSVGIILKRRFRIAGLDPDHYSAHSLRSGFLTSAADNGATVFQLMNVSRHCDLKTLQRYVRRRTDFDDYAGEGLL